MPRKMSKHLYTEILLWAYKKQTQGFTQPELSKAFNIQGELGQWVTRTFYTGNPPLIGHLMSKDGKDFYALTSSGLSTAIDYIELREARRSSKIATWTAIAAILISIAVGAWQIITTQDVRVTNEMIKTEILNLPQAGNSQ